MYYSLSRLSALDVKWADLFDANQESFQEFHHNPYYELILVADGTVYLQAGEEKLTLHAGDSLLLMPWEQHRGWQPNERQGHFFGFSLPPLPILLSWTMTEHPSLKSSMRLQARHRPLSSILKKHWSCQDGFKPATGTSCSAASRSLSSY